MKRNPVNKFVSDKDKISLYLIVSKSEGNLMCNFTNGCLGMIAFSNRCS